MTGSLVLDTVISVGGIFFVVLFSYFVGAFRSVCITKAAAQERAAFDEPDFVPKDWLVSVDNAAALSVSEEGEVLLAFSSGNRIGTRRLLAGQVRATRVGCELVVPAMDPGRPEIRVTAGSEMIAQRWLGLLNQSV